MLIQQNVSIQAMTTLRLRCVASHFFRVEDPSQLVEALAYAEAHSLELIILGEGSNIILPERLEALVVRLALSGREVLSESADELVVKAKAGENWDAFVAWTVDKGAWGLENLSLIPGQVGSAPIQNIGAYGVEVKDTLLELEAYDRQLKTIVCLKAADCEFAYRDSLFKREGLDRYIILSVSFKLSKARQAALGYGSIEAELKKNGIDEPSALQIRQLICSIRQQKLPDPAKVANAGSFFKNPVLPAKAYAAFIEAHPEAISFAHGHDYKLAAGWLIDQAGFKGQRRGNVGVYPKQALVLTSNGEACQKELLALATEIQQGVLERYGVALEIEPRVYA